ncbi:TPA: hypothetical protein ACTYJ3_005809, partial [Klebsiella pneumoniae]
GGFQFAAARLPWFRLRSLVSVSMYLVLLRLRYPLYCKQDIFIFYIQWLIFLLIGNTMKNTMLRKGLTIF